ncbi:DinB family protein [Flavobacterium sp.]|uniref:DinB family protein n=1 Tax=Flavobacterium sp. TaxID=239 RepID=UPI0038FC8B82
MMSNELITSEYSSFNATYINAVDQNVDLIDCFEMGFEEMISIISKTPFDKLKFRYAFGKWTIKDIIQHIIDVERIFSYRALRISRNDTTPLPGFEENDYVENTNANGRSIQDLLNELKVVRTATIILFKSFSNEQLKNLGIASNNPISVRAIGFIIIGHQHHHFKIIKERYLNIG